MGFREIMLSSYLSTKLSVLRHNFRRSDGRTPMSIRAEGGGLIRLRSQGRTIYLANLARWKLYRLGLNFRLTDLVKQYGLLDLAQEFPGKLVLDVGANIGEFSIYARDHGAKVIAFEPDPQNLKALRKNVEPLGVEVVGKALWKCPETLTFFSVTATADSSLIEPTSDVDTSYQVDAIPLDEFAKARNLGEIFLIKADAEGAEPEVLSGARETLKQTRYIAIDCGPERQGADTIEASTRILHDVGFEVAVLPGGRMVLFGRNRNLAAQ